MTSSIFSPWPYAQLSRRRTSRLSGARSGEASYSPVIRNRSASSGQTLSTQRVHAAANGVGSRSAKAGKSGPGAWWRQAGRTRGFSTPWSARRVAPIRAIRVIQVRPPPVACAYAVLALLAADPPGHQVLRGLGNIPPVVVERSNQCGYAEELVRDEEALVVHRVLVVLSHQSFSVCRRCCADGPGPVYAVGGLLLVSVLQPAGVRRCQWRGGGRLRRSRGLGPG